MGFGDSLLDGDDTVSALDGFCGEKFWDFNMTVNTNDPHFTSCFQRTALVWLPTVFLFICIPIQLGICINSKSPPLPRRHLNMAKLGVGFSLVLISTGQLIISLCDQFLADTGGTDLLRSQSVASALILISMVVLLLLLVGCKLRGLITSGVIFLSVLLFVLCGIPQIRSIIYDFIYEDDLDDQWSSAFFIVYFILLLSQLILVSFADEPYDDGSFVAENPSPEDRCSFLSRLTFWWINPLCLAGWKKPLGRKDLWSLSDYNSSSYLVPLFESYWNEALKKYYRKKAQTVEDQRKIEKENLSLLKREPKLPEPPSIVWCLISCFKGAFIPAIICRVISDLSQFLNPQILKLLLRFIKDPSAPDWQGYLLGVLLLVAATLVSLLLNQFFTFALRAGMNMKTCLISAIFTKALRLSNQSRRSSTIGQIVNLMAVDAQRFTDSCHQVINISSSCLMIIVALYFLYGILGPSVFAGVAVMLMLIPINGFLSGKQKELQRRQMRFKDDRIKLMNELLNGIKVLKLYAWEKPFQAQVEVIRQKELKVLRLASVLNAITTFTTTCAPFIVSCVSFAAFVLSDTNNVLDSEVAFVSLSLFNILRFPINMMPNFINNILQAAVANTRIKQFLVADEIDPNAVTRDPDADKAIVIENGNLRWEPDVKIDTLRNINLSIPKGSLVAVVGLVGSGKSSLISALLGEMEKQTGRINVDGSIAYVPQQAWIQNATVRDNIIFGKSGESEEVYQKVIEACALIPDLQILPGGDKTEVGEKGINMSGGQKQRISLARAVFQNSDIYLMDDPLSAVDSHVAKHIFDKVIGSTGMLAGKTRVLVTHGLGFLKYTDQIVVMSDGTISEVGSYSQLIKNGCAFAEFLETYLMKKPIGEGIVEEENEVFEDLLSDPDIKIGDVVRERLVSQISHISTHSDTSSPEKKLSVRRQSQKEEKAEVPPKDAETKTKGKLIDTEFMETKQVSWSVYRMYAEAIGYFCVLAVIVFFAGSNGFNIGSSQWLSAWSDKATANETDLDFRLGIYATLGIGQGFSIFFGALIMTYSMVSASAILHSRMLNILLCSPVSFYDVTPLGRILNRCGKDTDVLDNTIPSTVQSWLQCMLTVLSTVVVVVSSTPMFGVVLVPLGIFYYFIQRFYVATSRQLKRLESTSRSPIYSNFQEAIQGASSIRAYGAQRRFELISELRVDTNIATLYPTITSNRWITVRLEFLGNCIVLFAAIFAVAARSSVSAGLVGLSVSYAMTTTRNLSMAVRVSSDLESNIVSLERIIEYTNLETEAPRETKVKPPSGWPSEGRIEIENLSVRYRPGLDLVLKGISCEIRSKEKIGIVGRTGAGKSSLTLCLFRIIEAAGGKIIVDNLDISKLGLNDLRSRLTIIPQDPVLFSGTLRDNIDPFNTHSDEELWRALENAHLKDFVSSLPLRFGHSISEGGENLSVGQRQLICLARALLRKTRVLVLDEATAAVDLETDDLIQKTIRTEFHDSTVVTIAHRLNTIMDSSRVLVLSDGLIVEFDRPDRLLDNKSSIFYGMAKEAGLVA